MKKNYSLWLLARFFSNMAKQMQALIIAWQVYQISQKPLALGLIGLAEAIPFILVSIWSGAVVDRKEKRGMMMVSEAMLIVGTVALATLSLDPHPSLLLIYACSVWFGAANSFATVSSSAYVQISIPKDRFSQWSAVYLGNFLLTMVGGPVLAGWLLERMPVPAVYGVVAVLLVLSVLTTAFLKPLPAIERINEERRSEWASIAEGFRFIRQQPLLLSAMLLDMVAVLFGDCRALFPVFAQMFGVGPVGLGVLRAAPAIGGGVLSLVQAIRPVVTPSWLNLKRVVAVFGLSMIAFSILPWFWPAVIALMIGGAADGASVIIRQSMVQALTPDAMMGRISSVNAIFISASNEVGAFESGALAHVIGGGPAVFIGGIGTMLTVYVLGRIFKPLGEGRL